MHARCGLEKDHAGAASGQACMCDGKTCTCARMQSAHMYTHTSTQHMHSTYCMPPSHPRGGDVRVFQHVHELKRKLDAGEVRAEMACRYMNRCCRYEPPLCNAARACTRAYRMGFTGANLLRLGGGLSMAPFGAWHPSPRAAPPNVWQVVDLPAPEGPLDQPTEELIARVQAELDEAARA